MEITRAPGRRVHVTLPEEWNRAGGTDYWAVFGPESITAAAASSALLSDAGWTTTSLVETAGSGADFLSTDDRSSPAHVLTNATGDLLQSPAVFGDYGHAQIAAAILGYTPTRLCVEWYGAMTVAANETPSGWGLVEAGGTAGTDADAMAWVFTNGGGGTFVVRNGAGTTDTGVATFTTWAKFGIKGTLNGAWEWFIDDASQGTLAIQTDLFPVSFGMFASTTARPALAWVHIWYE